MSQVHLSHDEAIRREQQKGRIPEKFLQYNILQDIDGAAETLRTIREENPSPHITSSSIEKWLESSIGEEKILDILKGFDNKLRLAEDDYRGEFNFEGVDSLEKMDPDKLTRLFGIRPGKVKKSIMMLDEKALGYQFVIKTLDKLGERLDKWRDLFPADPNPAQILNFGLEYLKNLHTEPDRLDGYAYIGFLGAILSEMGYVWEHTHCLAFGKDADYSRHEVMASFMGIEIMREVISDLCQEKQVATADIETLEMAAMAIMKGIKEHEEPLKEDDNIIVRRVKEASICLNAGHQGAIRKVTRDFLVKGADLRQFPAKIDDWRLSTFDTDHTEPNYTLIAKLEAGVRKCVKVMKTSKSPAMVQLAKEKMKESFALMLNISVGHEIAERGFFYRGLQRLLQEARDVDSTLKVDNLKQMFYKIKTSDGLDLVSWLESQSSKAHSGQNYTAARAYDLLIIQLRELIESDDCEQFANILEEITKSPKFQIRDVWEEQRAYNIDSQNVLLSTLLFPEMIASHGPWLPGERIYCTHNEILSMYYEEWFENDLFREILAIGFGMKNWEEPEGGKAAIPETEDRDGLRAVFEDVYSMAMKLRHPRDTWKRKSVDNECSVNDQGKLDLTRFFDRYFHGPFGIGTNSMTEHDVRGEGGLRHAMQVRIVDAMNDWDREINPDILTSVDPGNIEYALTASKLTALRSLHMELDTYRAIAEGESGHYHPLIARMLKFYWRHLFPKDEDNISLSAMVARIQKMINEEENIIYDLNAHGADINVIAKEEVIVEVGDNGRDILDDIEDAQQLFGIYDLKESLGDKYNVISIEGTTDFNIVISDEELPKDCTFVFAIKTIDGKATFIKPSDMTVHNRTRAIDGASYVISDEQKRGFENKYCKLSMGDNTTTLVFRKAEAA